MKQDNITDFRSLTYEDWLEDYEPLLNEEGQPRLFKDSGEDQELIQDVSEYHVWTWMYGGDFSLICTGLLEPHRIGYYLTKVPFDPSQMLVIDMLDEIDEED
jgi:hypothetical protein